MAVNPMELMKMGERLKRFQEQHPRFPLFLREVDEKAVMPGTVIEIRATTPEGREYVTNIRLTPDDVESIQMAKNLR